MSAFDDQIDIFKKKLFDYKTQGKSIFATSSFQTHSIPMLHLIAQVDKSIPVFYLNTGYLFPETIRFKDQIQDLLGLNISGLRSHLPKNQQRDDAGNLLFTTDPDYCCHLNKIVPLQPVLDRFDVWINGIRADQNSNRSQMKEEEITPNGTLRYHPMLLWSNKMIYDYIRIHNLPKHPLENGGYISIGCEPCTHKYNQASDERAGRWFGLKKNECGLHTDLVNKE